MPYVIVRHRIEDYESWRTQFDREDQERRAAGCQGAHLFRNLTSMNEIVVLFEWDSVENAAVFTGSGALQESFPQAPNSGPRDIQLLESLRPTGV